MIISRTPLRISFFGGGTDLPGYYEQWPGRVISTGIQYYLYVLVREQAGFVEYPYRINWSQIEFCKEVDEIQHPIVREAFKMFEVDSPLEVATFSDIPAGTGLGSSSSFAVGLVNALHALNEESVGKDTLAIEAGEIEINRLGRVMGRQDHFAATYGTLNTYTFMSGGEVKVAPVRPEPTRQRLLEERLLLFYTGKQRNASEILEAQSSLTPRQVRSLRRMEGFVDSMSDILAGEGEISEIGSMLHESWMLKRSISSGISNEMIDQYYERALMAGASGGKILGAGGGGFLMLYVEPELKDGVERALDPLAAISPVFAVNGSQIVYAETSSIG